MIDLYLKASTKEALLKALPFLRYTDGKPVFYCPDYALDLVGPIYEKPESIALQERYRVRKPLRALSVEFHANLRCTLDLARKVPASIQIPKPPTLYRAWA